VDGATLLHLCAKMVVVEAIIERDAVHEQVYSKFVGCDDRH
jgi:hypothetical protein